MPRKRGRRKLTAAKVRAIFKSLEPVAKTAKKFGVSANLVYLIHGRKIHKEVTQSLRAPRRTGRRRRRGAVARSSTVRIDLDRLADRIVRHFLKRFRARG
jgi:transposase-like protein